MALEIVDDLATPGCANCAVKHLSAALTYLVMSLRNHSWSDDSSGELLARAYINLVEAAEGYHSHFPFALGLMAVAEEALVAEGDAETALHVREERTSLIAGGAKAIASALNGLAVLVSNRDMACGHLEEAKRELPNWDWKPCSLQIDVLVSTIGEIRREYFEFDKPEEKGGERHGV